jgi:Raf kinase inhibitor-like YbhB/YbcL family protein
MKSWQNICRIIVGGALIFVLFIQTFSSVAFAKERDVMKNVGSFIQWNAPVTLKLNDVTLPLEGQMINSKILIPFRMVFEALGAQVTWDEESQTVHALGKQVSLTQKIGESKVLINGIVYQLDQEAVIEGGNLMVAVRVLPLAFSTELKWDLISRTLTVSTKSISEQGLHIQSDAFHAFGDIPAKYAHGSAGEGKDVSLPVRWEGAPTGTKSFALVMYDLHPIADNWIHWSVLNLPASVSGLEEGITGKLKEGTETNPYFGMGPPPHSGDHQYRLVVYALDTDKVDVPNQPIFFEDLEPVLKEHSLAYAELDGFFKN